MKQYITAYTSDMNMKHTVLYFEKLLGVTLLKRSSEYAGTTYRWSSSVDDHSLVLSANAQVKTEEGLVDDKAPSDSILVQEDFATGLTSLIDKTKFVIVREQEL
jgi:hypothetical protein